MHLHGPGRRSKGGSIWIGLVLAGAVAIITITAIIKIGRLALAPFGFAALIASGLSCLTCVQHRADR